jgi:hypothetical protein
MQHVVGHILKSDEVNFEGTVQLGMPQAKIGQQGNGRSGSATQQVRIVESHREFAVIEVICSCGARTCIRCEYANAGTGDGANASAQANGQGTG